MPTVNLQQINLGSYANDGTGDDLRTAFEKVNANFADIQNVLPSQLIEDPNPTLGANLNLNGKNLSSSGPVLLNTSMFTVSGSIEATNFVGQISNINNHSLDDLSDVTINYDDTPPSSGQGLVYNGVKWVPGTVNAALATLDGGAASAVFIDDPYAIIDGGYADDSV